MSDDPSTVARLNELLTAIQGYGDPRRAAAEWKQAYKLLQTTALPQSRVTHVVAMRDLAGLKDFIAQLRAPAAPAATASEEAEFVETCRKALRAFSRVRRHLRTIQIVCGVLLMLYGALLISGEFSRLSSLLPRWISW